MVEEEHSSQETEEVKSIKDEKASDEKENTEDETLTCKAEVK